MHRWSSYLAIGDSFTEGLEDARADGSYAGWADRLAGMLAEQNPDLKYGNLAVRGRMMQEIIDEQIPQALEAKPDLVTICAGGNDVIFPGTDVDGIGVRFDKAVEELQEVGAEVVIFIGPDTKRTPLLRRVRPKVAIYNCHLWSIANARGCKVVDLWGMEVLKDRRAWCPDRLHMSSLGHHRVALRTAEVLGINTSESWNTPWPPAQRPGWLELRRDDYQWTRTHLLPWVRRQLRGESTGDGLTPKRPRLAPLHTENGPVGRENGASGRENGSGQRGNDTRVGSDV